MALKSIEKHLPPVAIGGVGGSGTRVVAHCLKELGFFIGSDLNRPNDNLWFTLLFKRTEILDLSNVEFDELVAIFFKGMTGSGQFTDAQIDLIQKLAAVERDQHPVPWLQKRADSLLSQNCIVSPDVRLGWKEPSTHVVIDRLRKTIPNLKYIHVMRNGLDMAHSANQNQLQFWGKHFIGSDYELSPFYSLKYWCIVHQRMLEIGRSFGMDFLLLNYDDFTLYPTKGLETLLKFLDLAVAPEQISRLAEYIKVPESRGRFKQYGIKIFDGSDVAFVKQLGFVIDEE